MKLAGEAGSLLKIEDEIRGPIGEARKRWESQSEHARDKKGRTLLFTVGQMEDLARDPRPTLDLTGITDDEFWDEAEPRLLSELQKYATRAANGRESNNVYAEDAAHGFAFVDLCRRAL